MSKEKADTDGLRKELSDVVDSIDEGIDENIDEGRGRFKELTSGFREKIESIGDSDDDKKLKKKLSKAREHLDEIEMEIDENSDEGRETMSEIVEDARARLDELEDRAHGR